MTSKKYHWGWMRHVLTVLSITILLLGSIFIGYITWVMATSTAPNRFLSGTQIITYVVVGLGFLLFFNGLTGWVGTVTKKLWLLRVFLLTSVACLLAEIGGIIALNIIKVQIDDILETGWLEFNQETRNLVQSNMGCCGFSGPREFAHSNQPIDESCYESPEPLDLFQLPSTAELNLKWNITTSPLLHLKQEGCGWKLAQWFQQNKAAWVAALATIGAVEFLAAAVALFILRRIQSVSRPRTFSRRRLRQHEAEIANDPLPSELPEDV